MTPRRTIGDLEVAAVGFGAAGLSVGDPPDEQAAIATINAALDAGVTLIDTAACYTPSERLPGHNEALIAKALASRDRSGVVVATKGGVRRIATGGTLATDFVADATPDGLRRQCEISLSALGVDCIDLLQLHAPSDDVPLAESVGALAELKQEGKARHIGLANVTVEQLTEALAVADIASVQNRFSPAHRSSADVIAHCQERSIAFLAYSPLGGLGQRARDMPAENPAFAEVAAERGVSPHRVALAWELAIADVVIPIPGARRPETIIDSAAAVGLVLTPYELRRLDETATASP